jgi:putative DeoR family transcriptional regulator (stage III sporulation protein D)
MKEYIEERVKEVANYMILAKATIRGTAKVFGVSKSTIEKDISQRLPKINAQLKADVRKVIEVNLLERHLRGGAATAQKYKSM